MVLRGTFKLGGDFIEVIIKGNEVLFYDLATHTLTPVSGLKLSKAGTIKEFPDLAEDKEWKKKAIERLRTHIKSIKTEDKRLDYIKEELIKYGYEPQFKQKAGWRPKKF